MAPDPRPRQADREVTFRRLLSKFQVRLARNRWAVADKGTIIIMDVEAAQLVLIAITGMGAIVWVVGLNYLSRCYRSRPSAESLAFGDAIATHGLIGGTEVDGQPRQLAARV